MKSTSSHRPKTKKHFFAVEKYPRLIKDIESPTEKVWLFVANELLKEEW